MSDKTKRILESEAIEASAPCRLDMGGTIDIRTFYLPLRHLAPCTFNLAIDRRTHVRLLPNRRGFVKISSKGFDSAEFAAGQLPFDHPLGLMFNIAAYFQAHAIHIDIESGSPPRSALGGSSAAAVALVAALSKLSAMAGSNTPYSKRETAMLAFALEESIAGVPCGIQDQLAAAYGGVNAWYWQGGVAGPRYRKNIVVPKIQHKALEQHLLLAYCGKPHQSKNINGRWVKQFLGGRHRDLWADIIRHTHQFIEAIRQRDYPKAAASMNKETAIRRRMTPDVLDEIGQQLVAAAIKHRCGARFTGAGGGGCIWALGALEHIGRLRSVWQGILATRQKACLIDLKIDARGLTVY